MNPSPEVYRCILFFTLTRVAIVSISHSSCVSALLAAVVISTHSTRQPPYNWPIVRGQMVEALAAQVLCVRAARRLHLSTGLHTFCTPAVFSRCTRQPTGLQSPHVSVVFFLSGLNIKKSTKQSICSTIATSTVSKHTSGGNLAP